ncbi:helix-turn-helix domain-containing protein [Streptomyces sp. NPDC079020]|uniref:helix-turn-helix domain-containing protein n=1 Tax=Streptomyces sp. NPDC079020 TaxID=3365722 RepID=UPI0037D57F0F
MVVEGRIPDPRGARGPAEFVALLRALKDASGLTFRELADRAEAVGDVLPRSTIANMLSRATIPREELLTAFVRACGCAPEETERWLAARKEIVVPGAPFAPETAAGARADAGTREHAGAPEHAGAADSAGAVEHAGAADSLRAADPAGAAAEATDPVDVVASPEPGASAPAPVSTPAPAPAPVSAPVSAHLSAPAPVPTDRRRRRRRTALVATAGVAVLAAATVSVVLLVKDGEKVPPLSAPAPGPVKIRAVHSGICLAERDNRSGRLYQVPCASASVPGFALRPMGDSVWRLETDHPDYGPGCTGVWDGGTEIGAALQDQECGKRGEAEAFWVEPVGDPVRGYRLRPTHTGLCAGIDDAVEDRGAQAVQLSCEGRNDGLLFSFDPA